MDDINVEYVEEQGKGGVEEYDVDDPDLVPQMKHSVSLRRDPEEEFFMLAVLALKMQHTENQDAEFIYQVDSQKLFETVKELKIPFHKWYQWIDAELQLIKIRYEEEQENIYADPLKNPEGLLNPLKRGDENSTKSSGKTASEASPFGIFD